MYDKENKLTAEELLIEAQKYPDEADARAFIRQLDDALRDVKICELLLKKKEANEPFPNDELDSLIPHDEHFESIKKYYQETWDHSEIESLLHYFQRHVDGLTNKGNHMIDYYRYHKELKQKEAQPTEDRQKIRRNRFVGTEADIAIRKNGVWLVWDNETKQFVPEKDLKQNKKGECRFWQK